MQYGIDHIALPLILSIGHCPLSVLVLIGVCIDIQKLVLDSVENKFT